MKEQLSNRQWATVEIPIADFRQRMEQAIATEPTSDSTTRNGSVYSRLALIHQVAKAYASAKAPAYAAVEIEELTNPPLYEADLNDEPVIIQFSYQT